MAILYSDGVFLEHRTGAGHPERPQRLSYTIGHLQRRGLWGRCRHGRCPELSEAALARVHTVRLVQRVRRLAEGGGGLMGPDTPVSAMSYRAAATAAGAAAAAVDTVLAGPDRQAVCLVRPPGHHALPGRSMGFCLFNNVAIAADHALSSGGLDRILIVDWDVHHGNGTQQIFYEEPRVMFFSIHRYPFYPGTGAKDEIGAGRGRGYTRNEPIRFGTPRREYRRRFLRALHESADKVRPQIVLVSAGFDAHAADPVGSLRLTADDFQLMTKWVLQVAHSHAEGRLVAVLEGGYNLSALARCVERMLGVILDL